MGPQIDNDLSFIDFILVLHKVLEAGSANISTHMLVYPWFTANKHHDWELIRIIPLMNKNSQQLHRVP